MANKKYGITLRQLKTHFKDVKLKIFIDLDI